MKRRGRRCPYEADGDDVGEGRGEHGEDRGTAGKRPRKKEKGKERGVLRRQGKTGRTWVSWGGEVALEL